MVLTRYPVCTVVEQKIRTIELDGKTIKLQIVRSSSLKHLALVP